MRREARKGLVADVRIYRVTAERSEKYWAVYVREIDRWTQARNLREIEPMARDLIAVMEQVPADSFSVDIDIQRPATVAARLHRAKELAAVAAAAQSESAAEVRLAARELHDDGVPLRDIGTILGVSFQRAHQLVGAQESAPRTPTSSSASSASAPKSTVRVATGAAAKSTIREASTGKFVTRKSSAGSAATIRTKSGAASARP